MIDIQNIDDVQSEIRKQSSEMVKIEHAFDELIRLRNLPLAELGKVKQRLIKRLQDDLDFKS